ncbi:MAG: hypothetical protein Q8L76_10105 [Cypionkella sp.]|jgi:hypothetical protein|nr:hypothetical protein [Cypionkella sp.]
MACGKRGHSEQKRGLPAPGQGKIAQRAEREAEADQRRNAGRMGESHDGEQTCRCCL